MDAHVRCACIDIGSNTTRLLVAEPDPTRRGALREVAASRAFVRLTADERRSGVPASKVAAIAEAVAEQALTARANDIAALRVVATAALREAPGREAVLAALAEAAGCPVEILSGEEEARLAFAGATAGVEADGLTVGVVDIGGGSTELAAGTLSGGVRWWTSVPVGSGALADAHLHDDPPTAAQLAAARAEADAALAAAGCPGTDRAWAVGGNATSLRRLAGEELSVEALERALQKLLVLPAFETAVDLDLHVERVRLMPAGLVLLAAAVQALGCPLRVGGGGVREGVVLDLLARVG